MLLDVFLEGDVYIDYPFEDVKFRYEKQTGKVYCRFYGKSENEIEPRSNLYHEAISTGKQITRDEYFRDRAACRRSLKVAVQREALKLISLSPTVRGMLWMTANGALFVVLSAILKKLTQDLDPWQLGFLRYAMGAIVILPPALRLGVRALWPKVPKLQFFRGLLHGGGMLLWFAALPLVTLADLTAIGFSGPIFVCLGAVLFLRERMTGARWSAVLVGFSGVMIVLQPWRGGSFSAESSGMLLMLASALVFAGSFLVAKVLTRHDRPAVIVLWQHLWVSLLLVPFMLPRWTLPSAGEWLALAVCGVLGAVGHYCMARAFQAADLSALQSVRFLELAWATILGYLIFAATPSGWTVIGGAVIFVSTLWLARHESRSPR